MRTLDQLMKVQARAAQDDFYRDGKLWAPLWLIENMDNKRLLIAAPMDENADRDKYAQMIRAAIHKFGGVRYAYAVEAWFLTLPEGAPPTTRPSTSPDRKEAILIQGEDINGDQQSIMYEIKRLPGKSPTLEKAMKGDEINGRFANMFSVGPYT